MNRRLHFAVAARGAFGEPILPGSQRHVISPIISTFAPDVASSVISQVAAPAITGALVGAGTGLLTHGNVGEDALIGGLGGGALGYAMSGPNDALTGLTSNLFGGSGSTAAALPGGASDSDLVVPVSPDNPSGYILPPDPATGAPGTIGTPTSQSADVAGTGGGLFGGKPGGISGTSVALGALAGLGSLFNKPKVGTWATPSPASVAANTGPLFNAPLNTNVPGRTAVTPNVPNYYTYGQTPEQTYFTGNSLQNYGFAHGGALSRGVFDTRKGEQFVRGPGTGTSDEVPARLSDGEYVLTAADVSRLGGGSNERGAARLDQDRSALAHAIGEKKFVRKPLKNARRAA